MPRFFGAPSKKGKGLQSRQPTKPLHGSFRERRLAEQKTVSPKNKVEKKGRAVKKPKKGN